MNLPYETSLASRERDRKLMFNWIYMVKQVFKNKYIILWRKRRWQCHNMWQQKIPHSINCIEMVTHNQSPLIKCEKCLSRAFKQFSNCTSIVYFCSPAHTRKNRFRNKFNNLLAVLLASKTRRQLNERMIVQIGKQYGIWCYFMYSSFFAFNLLSSFCCFFLFTTLWSNKKKIILTLIIIPKEMAID